MRRRLVVGGGAGLAVVVAAVLGPVPRADEPDVAAIAARVPAGPTEAAAAYAAPDVGVVKPEHARGVVFPQGPRKAPWALVYLHGFSATRAEIAPTVDRVAERVGGNAVYARLAGHGQPGAALAEATAGQWLADAAEAIEVGARVGERIVVIGTSTGGSLAAAALARHPDPRVAGVVLISPNFGPKDHAAEVLLTPWLSSLVPLVLGERHWDPVNEAQGANWTTTYPSTALRPMMAAVAAARGADLSKLPRSLWVWNPEDPVIDGAYVEAAFARAHDAEAWRVQVGGGEEGHVLAGDILAPQRTDEVVARITAFVMALQGPEHAPTLPTP